MAKSTRLNRKLFFVNGMISSEESCGIFEIGSFRMGVAKVLLKEKRGEATLHNDEPLRELER